MLARGVRTFWAQNILQEKSTIITKILNFTNFLNIILCTKMFKYSHYTYCLIVGNNNFICQNVPIFPLCILPLRRINTFWPGGIEVFWSRVNKTVWHRNSHPKINNIHKILFVLNQLFINNFLCQTVPKFSFYILAKLYSI